MWNREYHQWHSPSLGRRMELLVLGHGGARVLVFPTSAGRFYEWEDRGMAAALGEHLRRGRVQLVCVDSVDAESWFARDRPHRPQHERAARHEAYEAYLLNEVLPFLRDGDPRPFVITAGASSGAYDALNLAFHHPRAVHRAIGLSGLYDLGEVMGMHHDAAVAKNDPAHYVLHESDPGQLEAIRRLDLILATGRDDPARPTNERLSGVLWSKGIWHALRLWDGRCHDWTWWREMIVRYIGGAC